MKLVFAGAAALAGWFVLARSGGPSAVESSLALGTLAWLLWLAGTGCWLLGGATMRALAFPFALLLFMIPFPAWLRAGIETGLQHGSAAVADWMFVLAGTPVWCEGTQFQLPGITLAVAPECSGIRSWLAFVLGAILATRVCLRSGWGMSALLAMTVPIAIFKNAIRIVLLATLSVYVNRGIIDSPLHHQGGPVFALIDIAIFVPLLIIFQRLETRGFGRKKRATDGVAFAPVR